MSVVTAETDESADQRVYQKAQQAILEMIEGPEFSAGDRIPSERDLSTRFGISRMTMRKAINNLVDQGVLERRSTAGTFITTPSVERPFDQDSPYSISQIVEQRGANPGSRLLFFELAEANPKVAKRLAIEPGAALIVIRRLRLANNIPFCVETSYLPAARVPGLVAADLMGDASLYSLLKTRYGITIIGGEGLVSVSPTTAQEAELLGLKPESLALIYRTVAQDQADKPIEYLTSVNHPQRVVFRSKHGALPIG